MTLIGGGGGGGGVGKEENIVLLKSWNFFNIKVHKSFTQCVNVKNDDMTFINEMNLRDIWKDK